MSEPLRLEVEVACPPATAFAVWTERTSMWWPASHTTTAADGLTVTIEGAVGGRIYERTPAGEEVEWGRVLVWEPPHRLVCTWHLRQDAADATEVELRFEPSGDGCLVRIEHRGWERLGRRGPERRDANRQGWAGLLPHFVEACAAG